MTKMEQNSDTPQPAPPSLFVGCDVSSAITQASQSQSILLVCIQGHNEEDEKLEIELWQNSQTHLLLKDCLCLRLWDNTAEALQFKEYNKVTQTPTIYFFGLKQTTLLVVEGYTTFDQFSEKYSTVKEIFTKQVNDIKQIMQLLLLQQLQNSQNQQQTPTTNTTTSTNTNNIHASNKMSTSKAPSNNNNSTHSNSKTNNHKTTNSNNSINNNNNNNNSNNNKKDSVTITSTTKTNDKKKDDLTPTPTPTPAPVKNVKLNATNNTTEVAKPVERHVSSLAFRLTNSHVIKAQFSPYDTLSTAVEFIDKNRTDGKHKYILMTLYPKRVFKVEDYESTLTQLDLVPSSTLVLVATDPNAKPLPHPEATPEPTISSTTPSSTSFSSSSSSTSTTPSTAPGMLSSVSNYIWGLFGSNTPAASTSNTGKKNGSMWEYDQASKKEETAKNNNKDQQASSVGIRNRGRNVHQLNGDAKKDGKDGGGDDDDDKNNYWNGNSTQFQ